MLADQKSLLLASLFIFRYFSSFSLVFCFNSSDLFRFFFFILFVMSFFYFFFLSLSFFISFILFPIFPFLFFNLIPSDFSFSSFAHFLSVFSLFQIIWRHCFLPFVLLASTHFNFIFFYFFWPFLVSFLLLPLVFLFFFSLSLEILMHYFMPHRTHQCEISFHQIQIIKKSRWKIEIKFSFAGV